MSEEFDIDSCFDGALNAEATFVEEGKQEGWGYGEKVGLEDGKLLGLEKGFEFGEELGLVYGSALFWNNVVDNSPSKYSKRTQLVIKKLLQIIQEFPSSPTDDQYDEKLDVIRNTFKQANALMKSKLKIPSNTYEQPLSF